jgi:cobalt-zinc-cadmium efflux system protein
MGHGHNHSHHAAGNIGIAFLLNFVFAILELIGGFLTGSVAILADAVHDFGDSLTLGVAFILQKLSARGRSSEYSYGYGRLSLLSAIITGVILSAGTIFVLYAALPRLFSAAEAEVPHSLGMMAFALLGVGVNGFAAWRLQHGHTQNEKMLTWHMLEDLFGWVAVLIGAVVIHFTQWAWVDPALAVFFSLFILWNVLKNLWHTLRIFLQGVPESFAEAKFRAAVAALPGVEGVHDVHAWSLDGESNILSLHLVVKESALAAKLKAEVRRIAASFGKFHTTIEVETKGDACLDDCDEEKKIFLPVHDHGDCGHKH